MAEDYQKMTVAELKELLKEANLPLSGKKADLVARLVEANDAAPAAEEPSDDDWDDDGDWDDEAVEGHVAKQKPVLDDDIKAALALRAEQKKMTPSFRRTEWFRYKRLSRSGWRAPPRDGQQATTKLPLPWFTCACWSRQGCSRSWTSPIWLRRSHGAEHNRSRINRPRNPGCTCWPKRWRSKARTHLLTSR